MGQANRAPKDNPKHKRRYMVTENAIERLRQLIPTIGFRDDADLGNLIDQKVQEAVLHDKPRPFKYQGEVQRTIEFLISGIEIYCVIASNKRGGSCAESIVTVSDHPFKAPSSRIPVSTKLGAIAPQLADVNAKTPEPKTRRVVEPSNSEPQLKPVPVQTPKNNTEPQWILVVNDEVTFLPKDEVPEAAASFMNDGYRVQIYKPVVAKTKVTVEIDD